MENNNKIEGNAGIAVHIANFNVFDAMGAVVMRLFVSRYYFHAKQRGRRICRSQK